MLVAQRETRWTLCGLMKRVTQLSLTGSLAIVEAKFRIISRVGGIRRSVSVFVYRTSSCSCCRLSFCWFIAFVVCA
jgi:hypothetical protein